MKSAADSPESDRGCSSSTPQLHADAEAGTLEATMKVSFTAKEYARVLELVHYGLHVVNAYQGLDTPAAKRYAEIEQKLYELATPLGCGDLVTEAPNGALEPSEKLVRDERVDKILAEHTNDTFWHELVMRLAERDYATDQAKRHLGAATPGVDAPLSREDAILGYEDRLWAEFEKNDLANIVVLKGAKG